MNIIPQPGPQTAFFACSADICVYGGGAGGGKTWALLAENARHMHNGKFGSTIFRRTSKQVDAQGGLWDAAQEMYSGIPGVRFLEGNKKSVIFPSGAKIMFRHLQHEKNRKDYQGSEIALLCFDELTHFTRKQFIYLISRNRDIKSGVKPYIRATTNPEQGWVKEWLAPWVDKKWRKEENAAAEAEGRWSLAANSGEIRYYCREKWLHPEEHEFDPSLMKSVTFIQSLLSDNKILLEKDPGYEANLQAQTVVERARLLEGNWEVKEEDILFKTEWFPVVTEDAIPWDKLINPVRYWDLAGTDEKDKEKKTCNTAGVLLAQHKFSKMIYILDSRTWMKRPYDTRMKIKEVAEFDREIFGHKVKTYIEQEPGSSGIDTIEQYQMNMLGYYVEGDRPTGDKVVRSIPVSQNCKAGRVLMRQGAWNKAFLDEITNFPVGLKDQVDAFSGAYLKLTGHKRVHFASA